MLLWPGDILNAYAMMGLVLVLTRRWASWLLLAAGATFAVSTTIVDRLIWEHLIASPGTPLLYGALMESGARRRLPIFLNRDYAAFVRENVHGLWNEVYATTTGWAYLGWILGRFLVGSWFYRQRRVRHASRYTSGFRRLAAVLLPAALALALAVVGPAAGALSFQPHGEWQRVPMQLARRSSQLIVGWGYAACPVVLLQNPLWQHRLAGLAQPAGWRSSTISPRACSTSSCSTASAQACCDIPHPPSV